MRRMVRHTFFFKYEGIFNETLSYATSRRARGRLVGGELEYGERRLQRGPLLQTPLAPDGLVSFETSSSPRSGALRLTKRSLSDSSQTHAALSARLGGGRERQPGCQPLRFSSPASQKYRYELKSRSTGSRSTVT